MMNANPRHDDFRRAHDDYRRSYYDCRMTLVTPVPAMMPVPSAFRNQTAGGSEEGDKTAYKKDVLHIQFGLLHGVTLRGPHRLLYGV